MTWEQAIAVLNAIAVVIFLLLNGAILMSMLLRLREYMLADEKVNPLLRRGLVLFGALAVIGAEVLTLRVLTIQLDQNSIEMFLFILQYDIVLLGALAYYAKVEITER